MAMGTHGQTKPPEVFGRDQEWTDLIGFTTASGPGMRLGIVRGRRRQGKSFLLRRLASACDGFYYQALQEQSTGALEGLGAALGRHLNVPGGHIAFRSWTDAMEALAGLTRPDGTPFLVILDEFPYLLEHSPELQSILQRTLDARREPGAPPIRLILCGSALAVMSRLLAGTQALRGRAVLDLVVSSFDYRTAATFWGITDHRIAFSAYAVFGGTPGYRDLITVPSPATMADLGPWLAQGPLNPASALFREDDYLLTAEPTLTDRGLYHAVIAAIAEGKTTQGAIAAHIGREQRSVQYPLAALEESGFVVRDEDILRQRRPSYRLADPILRFHHAITRKDSARFEDRRTAEAWGDAGPRFRSQVLGPQFEQMARDFTLHHAAPATLGGVASRVGRTVVNDPAGRAVHELDVVAVDVSTQHGKPRVMVIGEAKHTHKPQTTGALRRLELIRSLVEDRGDVDASQAHLAIFSASGFDTDLLQTARDRTDVLLVDLDRLYEGA